MVLPGKLPPWPPRVSVSERATRPPSRRRRFGASTVAFAEVETERAGAAARERACRGVRGAKPLEKQMKRFFRIDYKGTPRHVIEAADGGPWRLLEGEIFGRYEAGE